MFRTTSLATLVSISLAASLYATTPSPAQANGFNDAVTGGQFKAVLRPRIEIVDQENFSDNAVATTLRGAFQYTTAPWQGLQLKAELEAVASLGAETYNSSTNGQTQYPVVKDPTGGHFNRLFLFHQGTGYTVGGGRDEIIYDNARWVGNVGWRQNHQTFDSIKLDGQSGALSYHAAYVFTRYSIAQYDRGNDLDNAYFLNGRYGFDFGKLAAYYYDYGFDGSNTDYRILGAALSGSPGNFVYRAEFANQEENNPGTDYSASYYHLIAGLKVAKMKFLLGYEFLGSDNGNFAVTPHFGTNHKFNGFADQFLTTPVYGLKDSYLTAVIPFLGNTFVATYHRFQPDSGASFDDYGSELDLVLARKLNKQVKLLAKLAAYTADSANPASDPNTTGKQDVTKLIVQATYAF